MIEDTSYEISFSEMKKMVKNYFKQEGRNVDLIIECDEDVDHYSNSVETIMSLIEKVTIAGIRTTARSYFSIDDLKEVISETFEKMGKSITSIDINATLEKKYDGCYNSDSYENVIKNKSFTVNTKTNSLSLTKDNK